MILSRLLAVVVYMANTRVSMPTDSVIMYVPAALQLDWRTPVESIALVPPELLEWVILVRFYAYSL